MRIEHCTMLLPARFVGREIGYFPATLADGRSVPEHRFRDFPFALGALSEPVLDVTLPVEIGGHLGQAAKTRLTLLQSRRRLLEFGDVAHGNANGQFSIVCNRCAFHLHVYRRTIDG